MEAQLIEIANMLADYHKEIDSIEGVGDKGICQLRHARLIIDRFKQQQKNTIEQRNAKLVEALEELIRLKSMKDNVGKTLEYIELMPIAWKNANQALKNTKNIEG